MPARPTNGKTATALRTASSSPSRDAPDADDASRRAGRKTIYPTIPLTEERYLRSSAEEGGASSSRLRACTARSRSCLKVRPAGAISKDATGIVKVDPDVCIGCKYCFQACPYEVPRYNSVSMDKCDCCQGAGVALRAAHLIAFARANSTPCASGRLTT
ncbi:MAG: 4Fe-4S dicluster domain-containing protein [Gordonibacter pamelaeae]